jgi:integrase
MAKVAFRVQAGDERMSVRRRTNRDRETGAAVTRWVIDIDFEHPDGRRERIRKVSPVQNQRGAEQYERELRQALLDERYGKKEVPTFAAFFAEFMETYAKANNKPSEIAAKECIFETHLAPFFGTTRLDEIAVRDIERFKAELKTKEKLRRKGKLGPKTINNVLTVLGKVLNYAVEIEVIGHAPPIKYMKVLAPKFDYFDFDELGVFLDAAKSEPEVFAAVLAVADAGLRVGEVRALEWRNIDLKGRRMTVAQTDWRGEIGSPKGGRMRTLDLTARLEQALREIRHLRGPFVFCDVGGARWTQKQADLRLEAVCKRGGLREVGWHVLRHTFCSHLAMLGVAAQTIQKLAGHSGLAVTERYMHLSPEHAGTAIRSLDRRSVSGTIAAPKSGTIENTSQNL